MQPPKVPSLALSLRFRREEHGSPHLFLPTQCHAWDMSGRMTGSREQLEELSGLSPSSGASWDTPGEDSASGFSSAKSRGRDRQEPAEQGGALCPCRPRGQGGFPAGDDWRCSVCSLNGHLGLCRWSRVITASLRLTEIHRPDSQRSTVACFIF